MRLGQDMLPAQSDKLAKELFKKLPKNTGMAKLFTGMTTLEIAAGLDAIDQACNKVKALLSLVSQAIRIANSYGPDGDNYRIELDV